MPLVGFGKLWVANLTILVARQNSPTVILAWFSLAFDFNPIEL